MVSVKMQRKFTSVNVADYRDKRWIMTEEQIKLICKWVIENSSRPFTVLEKEALKQAIDNSKSWGDLLAVAIMSRIV